MRLDGKCEGGNIKISHLRFYPLSAKAHSFVTVTQKGLLVDIEGMLTITQPYKATLSILRYMHIGDITLVRVSLPSIRA